MQMLYNSDAYVGVRFEPAAGDDADAARAGGGFEIVDKSARKGIYIEGPTAEGFERGVRALAADGEVDVEALDAYIAGVMGWAHQPLVLH